MRKLYSYFRSSAAFRVRIGLNLKGLAYDTVPVHLAHGEQRLPEHLQRSPQGLIPVLEDGDLRLTQSLAILEYLDEVQPQPPLLPSDAAGRARVRALALAIACDIHPLNNLRVLNRLQSEFSADEVARQRWYQHWVNTGLLAWQEQWRRWPAPPGPYAHGLAPGLADCCLIPQIYNAQRFNCDLQAIPDLMRMFDACMQLPAFAAAHPAQQPDAV
jgi:maleylacetoacetate isomerase